MLNGCSMDYLENKGCGTYVRCRYAYSCYCSSPELLYVHSRMTQFHRYCYSHWCICDAWLQ